VNQARIAAAVVVLVVAAGDAGAGQSFHERVSASPITKDGEVVGLRLKLTLRPLEYQRDHVRIGLGPKAATYDANYRALASDASQGYLLHQWPTIATTAAAFAVPARLRVAPKRARVPRPAARAASPTRIRP
jgi:hypothetical protein